VWWVIASLFLLAFGVLMSSPPATTLALAEYPQMAGTAGSLLGTVRFGFGGIAAPFVGIAGSLTILPLGIVTTLSVMLAAVSCVLIIGRHRQRNRARLLTMPTSSVPSSSVDSPEQASKEVDQSVLWSPPRR
jgi:DHA1 family bicyclomycin/chloramphenicol resistance-like MFS transporter